jgi:hypothetical protein
VVNGREFPSIARSNGEHPEEPASDPFESFAIRVCRDFLSGLKSFASPGPASDSAVPPDSAESQGSGDSRKGRHE